MNRINSTNTSIGRVLDGAPNVAPAVTLKMLVSMTADLSAQLQELLLEEMPQLTVDHLPLFFLGNEASKALVIGPSGIDDYTRIAL